MKILHVDSSILGDFSVSRQVSSAIVQRLQSQSPSATVAYRDLATDPIPYFIAPFASPDLSAQPAAVQGDAKKVQKALEDVLDADVIVVGAPMYNFGIPSQLKSWIDALAVPGKTFRYTPSGAEGLLGNKRIFVASSQGGIYQLGTPAASFEHQDSHLVAFFTFLGVKNIEVIRADGVKVGENGRSQGLERAFATIEAIAV